MRAKLETIEILNPNVSSFWFRPETSLNYTAGQFIELTLPTDNPDNRGVKRWFTLSSSPTEELLSITTKFAVPSSSFKSSLHDLVVGSELTISEPMGDFVLPKNNDLPIVMVAGGIGVTPFRSMIKWVIDSGEQRPIEMILAVKNIQDLIFLELFEAYGLQPIIVVTEPADDWQGESGQLSATKLTTLIKNLDQKTIYMSGPEAMVESLKIDLQKHGLNEHHIVGDFFPNYQSI